MLEVIPVTEARRKLLPLLSKIKGGDYRFMVTRHGKPLAVVINYEDYNRMTETLKFMEDRSWSRHIDAGLNQAREGKMIGINKDRTSHV